MGGALTKNPYLPSEKGEKQGRANHGKYKKRKNLEEKNRSTK